MSETTRTGTVRVLSRDDLPAVIRILTADPVGNVFVAARIRSGGLDEFVLGCQVWGYERDGILRSLCHAGSNLVPVNADEGALDAFVEFSGGRRTCSSIIGPAWEATTLWQKLADRYGADWSQVREVRARQPVMAIKTNSPIEANPRVRRVTLDHWDSYFNAAVRMYTEEVGVSPIKGNASGYRYYVRQLITSGRSFGLFEGDRVIFKADLGSVSGRVSQVQGVWVDPALRGQGLAAPAMAAVVQLAREVTPVVSLYVNDYNHRARATYARAGFAEVGEFATILY